jgi:hypothetical protein
MGMPQASIGRANANCPDREVSSTRKRRHSAADIRAILARVEEFQRQGVELEGAIAAAGVTETVYYRYLGRYGALREAQIARMRRLEVENARLRRRVTQLMLEKMDRQDALWLEL